MTRDEAKNKLGCKKLKDLADLLGITGEALAQWNPDSIPLLREYQVNEIYEKQIVQQGLGNTVNQSVAESNV